MSSARSDKTTPQSDARQATEGTQSQVSPSLRQARESKGLTLEGVRDRTGVPIDLLERLEDMDLAPVSDQRTLLTASRRYADVVGLDARQVCTTMLHAWERANWASVTGQVHLGSAMAPDVATGSRPAPGRGRAQAAAQGGKRNGTRKSRPRPTAASAMTPTTMVSPVTQGLEATTRQEVVGEETTRHRAVGFEHTAEIPSVGQRRTQPNDASLRFADTGPMAVTSRTAPARTRAPRWLRLTTTFASLILLLAVAGVAIDHYEPNWLAKAHLKHAQTAATTSVSGGSSQSQGQPQSHRSSSSSLVTETDAGSGSPQFQVHAKNYNVLVSAQYLCWINATGAQNSSSVFTGLVEGGQSKSLAPVSGNLSVELGASGVSLKVQVGGKTVPGWSFSPPTAPLTVTFVSA